MIDFDTYQSQAHTTAIYPERYKLLYPALGLAEEAGEVAGQVKRYIRDDESELTEARRAKLQAELGDVLWYLAEVATCLGISLSLIAQENIQKLLDRQARKALQGEGSAR